MNKLNKTKQNIQFLIVDDEPSIRLTFKMFLQRGGYGHIRTASTMEEALIAIQKYTFDLIISNIVFEKKWGTDLLCKIREAGVECPVIMVTDPLNPDTISDAVRYGAFDFIPKPVHPESLLKSVRKALKYKEVEHESRKLLQENEKFKCYLEAIFNSVRDAIIIIDNKMNIVQLNDIAKKWLPYTDIDNGKPINLENQWSDMAKACLQDVKQVLKSRKEVHEHQIECKKSDGNIRIISLNASALGDGKNGFHGVVIVARDITMPELKTDINTRNQFHGYVGSSQAMQNVYNLIENVGKVDTAVLITGESGTGKEIAAEALHAESGRSKMPFIKVDCTAMPEDLLENELFGHVRGAFSGAEKDKDGRLLQAHNGTLFLDEIGEISQCMQLRLLRFLQEKTFTPVGKDTAIKVDVRIIAATNVNLTEKVKNGSFREDLYYRLKVVEVKLPPLRDRNGGIPILVHHFISLFREQLKHYIYGISDQALDALSKYTWPGNVRELRNVIERACVLCEGSTIFLEHFPDEIQTPTIPKQQKTNNIAQQNSVISTLPPYISEEDEIIDILKRARGNKSKAARMLNIDRSTLYRKMQRIGISPDIAKQSIAKNH